MYTLSISLKYRISYSLIEFSIKSAPIITLLDVLSKSSILPYLIWKGLFFIIQWLRDRQTCYLVSFGYRNSNPISSSACSAGRYLSSRASILISQQSPFSTCPYNPYRPSALDSLPSLWSCTVDKQRFIFPKVLIDVHEFFACLFGAELNPDACGCSDAQVTHLANFNYTAADLFSSLPFLKQKISLHSKRIKYNL